MIMVKLVRESAEQRLTPEQFENWFNRIYNVQQWEDLPWKAMLSTLMNDEESTNEELVEVDTYP